MAQATQAGRAIPQAPSYPLAAVGAIIAAILLAGTLAFAAIDPFGWSRRSDRRSTRRSSSPGSSGSCSAASRAATSTR